QIHRVPISGFIGPSVIKHSLVYSLNCFKKLLFKAFLQIFSSIIVALSGIGKNTAWTLFSSGPNQCSHSDCVFVWVADFSYICAQSINQVVFFVGIVQTLES